MSSPTLSVEQILVALLSDPIGELRNGSSAPAWKLATSAKNKQLAFLQAIFEGWDNADVEFGLEPGQRQAIAKALKDSKDKRFKQTLGAMSRSFASNDRRVSVLVKAMVLTTNPDKLFENVDATIQKITGQPVPNTVSQVRAVAPLKDEEIFNVQDFMTFRNFSGLFDRHVISSVAMGEAHVRDREMYGLLTAQMDPLKDLIVIVTAKVPDLIKKQAGREAGDTFAASAVVILNYLGRVLAFMICKDEDNRLPLTSNAVDVPAGIALMSRDEMRMRVCDYINSARLVGFWHAPIDLCSLNLCVNRAKVISLATHPAVRAMGRSFLQQE